MRSVEPIEAQDGKYRVTVETPKIRNRVTRKPQESWNQVTIEIVE